MSARKQHDCGNLGHVRGASLSSEGTFYFERTRKPWAEKYHWATADRKPTAVYEIDELRNLYLFGGLDVPRKKANWTTSDCRTVKVATCPAPLFMKEEITGIPREEVLEPLVQESAMVGVNQAIRQRASLIGNQMQAWRESSKEILAVHTVGALGHKIALSRVSAGCGDEGLPDWDNATIGPIDTSECGLSEILQVEVSTAKMANELLRDSRFIAARSRSSVSFLSISCTNGDHKLSSHGQTTFPKCSITDVRFSPHAYSEAILGLDNGSVRVVDLDRLGGLPSGHSVGSIASELLFDFGAPFGKNCRTVVEYGSTPMQFYCGVGSSVNYLDKRVDMRVDDFAVLHWNETVTGLRNVQGNPASVGECPYLMAVTTNKRAMVYDLRNRNSPLLSWKLPSALGVANQADLLMCPPLPEADVGGSDWLEDGNVSGDFESGGGYGHSEPAVTSLRSIGNVENVLPSQSLSNDKDLEDYPEPVAIAETQSSQFRPVQSQPVGGGNGKSGHLMQPTLIVGSMVTGDFVQIPFMVGKSDVALIPNDDSDPRGTKRKGLASQPSRAVKIQKREGDEDGLPVRHERIVRTIDNPSILCSSLKSMKDFDSISCLDMQRLIARLDHKYSNKQGVTHRVLDLEAANLKGFIEHEVDARGVCFVPLDRISEEGGVGGILLRQNVVGDVVVDTYRRRNDEHGEDDLFSYFECPNGWGQGCDTELGQGQDGAGWRHVAQKWVTQADEADLGVHEAGLCNVEMVDTKVGRVREVNAANSDVRSSVWWDMKTHGNKVIPWLQQKNVSKDKLMSSIPLFLGKRVGSLGDSDSQLVLNFFNLYMELRAKMAEGFRKQGEVCHGWGLEEDVAEELCRVPGGLSVWELQQRKALAFYKNLEDFQQGRRSEDTPAGAESVMSLSSTKKRSHNKSFPYILVSILGERNLGAVHLCHEVKISNKLRSEEQDTTNSSIGVGCRSTKVLPPPDLLVDPTKSTEVRKWNYESKKLVSSFNVMWGRGLGASATLTNIKFTPSNFVQTWGANSNADKEESANLQEMWDKWSKAKGRSKRTRRAYCRSQPRPWLGQESS